MSLKQFKIVFSVMVFALFCTGFFISAVKVNAETTPTVSSVVTTPRTLKLVIPRIKGDDVKALQTFLNNSGYNCGIADGIFGPKTEAQVKLFQIANNLTADGKAGKNTLAIISQSPTSTNNQTITGCTSGALFSTTTGKSCASTPIVYTLGCTPDALFNTITGASCKTLSVLSAGCIPTPTTIYVTPTGFIYSTFTGNSCVAGLVAPTQVIKIIGGGSSGHAINSYTVTFDKNTGDTDANPTTRIADYNTTVTLPTAPTKTGYIFDSWNTLVNGIGDTFDVTTTVTDNIAVYAKWTAVSQTLTFNSNGGSAVTAITQDFATSVSAPSAPTKSGYTFSNWYNEVGLSTIHTFDTIGLTTTVYAKWNINTYNVTFDGNTNTGGTTAPQSLPYNTPTALTTNGFTKTGYTFASWNTQADGLGTSYANGASYTIGAAGVTLYAQWIEKTYALRSTGPGGGFVFYTTDGGLHGLEAAPLSTEWSDKQWGCSGTLITGADGTAVGTGAQNTIDIVNGCAEADRAARLASDLVSGGQSDWFLPSKDELNKIYINLKSGTDENSVVYTPVGGFTSIDYWSSSEFDATRAWAQYFTNGNQYGYGKNNPPYVRAVRAF